MENKSKNSRKTEEKDSNDSYCLYCLGTSREIWIAICGQMKNELRVQKVFV